MELSRFEGLLTPAGEGKSCPPDRFAWFRRLGYGLLCSVLLIQSAGATNAAEADSQKSADAPTEAEKENADTPAGHSYHGEVFNEGPRQSALLMEGMGNVDFPSSAKEETTRAFINQGVAALHGFWYLEAERSFRQAAKIEPDLAICYWGMAEANTNNLERARKFIDQAVSRKESASRREQLLIDATNKYLKPQDKENDDQKKRRVLDFYRDLEGIIHEFPEDTEAKAWLALQMWKGAGNGVQITSHIAVDALLEQVFAANPMHPAHHYRIHLWDNQRPESALRSAALCGPSLPGIAHMWHMPGHIYSRLKRYNDAAWQQEASARVDHSHMIRTQLLPDQIHNFAHNNEWLTRNLIFLGRVQDALLQSHNLVSMPKHPKYNTDRRGSFQYGRTRLLQTLTEYELWDQLIEESSGPFLAPSDHTDHQIERLAWVATAYRLTGKEEEAKRTIRQIRRRLLESESKELDLEEQIDQLALNPPPADADPKPPTKEQLEKDAQEQRKQIDQIEKWLRLPALAEAVRAKKVDAVEEQLRGAPGLDDALKASFLFQAGANDKAIEQLKKLVERDPHQVRPLALLVHVLWTAGQQDAAREHFEKLRTVAGYADIETPLLARLRPVADSANISGDWRTPAPPADDLGERPPLDSLGPFRWQPPMAPSFSVQAADEQLVTDAQFQGKPRVVIFYLGAGCLHCVEQLHAFAPKMQQFNELGIDLFAISTENLDDLRKGIERFEGEMPIRLYADSEHNVFKAYRCWDDFEDQALHGTFLIDAQGRIRWQDIGYEPFTDVDFVINESKRLLAIPE